MNPQKGKPFAQGSTRSSGPAEASMDAFEEEVARRLAEEQARLATARQRGNWTPLDCLAFEKMKQLGWSAVKSDKDFSRSMIEKPSSVAYYMMRSISSWPLQPSIIVLGWQTTISTMVGFIQPALFTVRAPLRICLMGGKEL